MKNGISFGVLEFRPDHPEHVDMLYLEITEPQRFVNPRLLEKLTAMEMARGLRRLGRAVRLGGLTLTT